MHSLLPSATRSSTPTCLLLFGLLIIATAVAVSASEWRMTFEDDFDGDMLNTSRWSVAHNMTHGPLELQLYVSDEVYLENGDLVLRTRRRRGALNATFMYVLVAVLMMALRMMMRITMTITAMLPSPS